MHIQIPEEHKLDPSKEKTPLLWSLEQKWISLVVPHVPRFLNGINLTLVSILWAVLIVMFGWLAQINLQWIWGISVILVLHYITDSLDGAVGRYRQSGLIKWGHYMDHFLDYLFMGAVMVSYYLFLPRYELLVLSLLVLVGSIMASTYLMAGITDKIRMGYFNVGLTEIRLGILIINTLIIFFGTHLMLYVLVFLNLFALIVLIVSIYRSQEIAYAIDKEREIRKDFGPKP